MSVRIRRPRPLACADAVAKADDDGLEGVPRGDPAEEGNRARAVRVVELQNCRLRERVGRPRPGHRVIRIALQLGRAANVGLGQDRLGVALEQGRGREVERLSRNDLLWLTDVGQGLFVRHVAAGGETGQHHRRRHQPQERAPVGLRSGRRRPGTRPRRSGESLGLCDVLETAPEAPALAVGEATAKGCQVRHGFRRRKDRQRMAGWRTGGHGRSIGDRYSSGSDCRR